MNLHARTHSTEANSIKMFWVLSVGGPHWPLSLFSSFNLGRFALGNSFVVDYPSFLPDAAFAFPPSSPPYPNSFRPLRGQFVDPFPFHILLCCVPELIKYLESEVAKPRAQLSLVSTGWGPIKVCPSPRSEIIQQLGDECGQIGTIVRKRLMLRFSVTLGMDDSRTLLRRGW